MVKANQPLDQRDCLADDISPLLMHYKPQFHNKVCESRFYKNIRKVLSINIYIINFKNKTIFYMHICDSSSYFAYLLVVIKADGLRL